MLQTERWVNPYPWLLGYDRPPKYLSAPFEVNFIRQSEEFRDTMSAHIYKKIELVGSSTESSDKAVENALTRASQTIHNIDWFEVTETRGHVVNGKVAHWQVVLKVGFRLEDASNH